MIEVMLSVGFQQVVLDWKARDMFIIWDYTKLAFLNHWNSALFRHHN